jgi:hypothetical protein
LNDKNYLDVPAELRIAILKNSVSPIIEELEKGTQIEEYSTNMIGYLTSNLMDLTKIR